MISRLCMLTLSLSLAACEAHGTSNTAADQGAELIAQKGCGLCHAIPGIAGADGRVGPPLEHMANRVYIAGMLRNTPENMVKWLRDPQAIAPGNAMPAVGLTRSEAVAVTAYLETLE
jgi:cytochrome c